MVEHGTEPRVDESLSPPWAAAAETLGEAFPQGKGALCMEVFDPVGDRLARHVQALRHRGQTFTLVEPEQSLYTAECLGLRGVCSERLQ